MDVFMTSKLRSREANTGCCRLLSVAPELALVQASQLLQVLVQTVPTSAQTLLGAQLAQALMQL
jgi:hypothetical protein